MMNLVSGSSDVEAAAGYTLRPALDAALTGCEAEDWDSFVEAAPEGELVQTTAWAKSKEALGFDTCRAVVREGARLTGGAQIIIKRFGPVGGVGYVARGPLIARDDPAQLARVLDEIERVARARRVRHLIVQPPEGGESIIPELQRRGYSRGALEVAPSATMRIDLTPSLDQIFANFSETRRKELRRSQRNGVEIRTGSRSDLEVFCALHRATAQRQEFQAMSKAYLRNHWDVLHARGAVQLFFACHGGRPLAGLLVTLFQNTVLRRLGGWTGEPSKLYPSLACDWGVIQWAKAQGFRYYDLGGIDRRYAELLSGEEPVPQNLLRSAHFFKTTLGAEVVLLPEAWHFTFNAFARLVVPHVYAQLSQSKRFHKLVDRFRDGAGMSLLRRRIAR